jgi:hypothetical protein
MPPLVRIEPVLGGRPDGIRVGRMGQHHARHAAAQRRGEQATQGQEDHTPNAVSHEDDGAGTKKREDGIQRPRHHVKTIVGCRGACRAAQSW